MNKLVTKDEYEIVTWCWANDIYIAPHAVPTPKKHWAIPDVKIQIQRGEKIIYSPKVYEQDSKHKRKVLNDKIFELYKHYYDRLN